MDAGATATSACACPAPARATGEDGVRSDPPVGRRQPGRPNPDPRHHPTNDPADADRGDRRALMAQADAVREAASIEVAWRRAQPASEAPSVGEMTGVVARGRMDLPTGRYVPIPPACLSQRDGSDDAEGRDQARCRSTSGRSLAKSSRFGQAARAASRSARTSRGPRAASRRTGGGPRSGARGARDR